MKTLKKFIPVFLLLFLGLNVFAQSAYIGKPRYQIYTTRAGIPLGTINVELFQTVAPYHVKNFDSLVGKSFYDTTAFHRVIPGFMIQGGDPNSRHGPISTWGFGQPSQPKVNAEFSVIKHERGILSAARSSNINSATSQFFICVASAPNLNGQYSVYGRVTSGMNIMDTIVNEPRNMTTNNPLKKIEMFVTFIGVNDTMPSAPQLVSPPTNTVGTDTLSVMLKWNLVSSGLIYKVHVSSDSLFSDTLKLQNLTTSQYNCSLLKPSTTYYWKVQVNNGGFFVDSQTWNFTTKSAGGIVTKLNEVKTPLLPQVFPNPSSQHFTFSNLHPDYLIEIFDITGRSLSVTEVRGTHYNLDMGEQPKGVYFYKVKKGSQEIKNGKLILK